MRNLISVATALIGAGFLYACGGGGSSDSSVGRAVITSVSPQTGGNGDTITVSGSGFSTLSGAQVTFEYSQTGSATVDPVSKSATTTSVLSDTQAVAVVPVISAGAPNAQSVNIGDTRGTAYRPAASPFTFKYTRENLP